MSMPVVMPSGTITFLFTDIEGSTKLWEQNPGAMRPALARHDQLLRQAIEASGGYVFKTIGDAFCAAFVTTQDAVQAALACQLALNAVTWQTETNLRVRMALHSGQAAERDGDYFGLPVNRVARLLAIAHGGQTILSQNAAAALEEALPADITLRDMASHRLKDLTLPEHVWQLCHSGLPSDFPPLRSLQAFANNLPLQMTSFVGRYAEMEAVKSLLSTHRLVTLTGAGGTGKTRLSLQVAADLVEQYGDGVFLAELAALSDPALVPQAVAGALGVREEPGQTLMETLTAYLRSKSLLLLLDNCEHLIDACAALTQTLLQSCAKLQVLATSREALNVAGEKTWRVPALAVPAAGKLPLGEKDIAAVLLDYDGPRLFVERARLQQGGFVLSRGNVEAVASVCSRLDGIPLAIELAAARVRSLAVGEINARLDDRFRLLTGGSRMALPRQQTLRAMIDWSYDLLTEPEKALLCRLSVFAGGWTLEAAEAVCAGEPVEDWEALDLLTSLVDKSLAVAETGEDRTRYRLLETVRQYGVDRLAESGEADAWRKRHAAWFLALAEEAEPQLAGPEQGVWLSRLEMEHDNLRAALAWGDQDKPGLKGRGNLEAGLRLCGALWRFWSIRGHQTEGLQWSRQVLRDMDLADMNLRDTDGRRASAAGGKALKAAGHLAYDQSDYAAARIFYEQSLEIKRQIGDQSGIAYALNALGILSDNQGDYAAARAFLEQSLEILRQIGDRQGVAYALNNLGNLSYAQGDYVAARAFHEQSLEIKRQIGDQSGIASSLNSLGIVSYAQSDYAAARAFYGQSLEIRHRIGNQQGIALSLDGLAVLASSQGQPERGVSLWGAAAALREQIGAPLSPAQRQKREPEIAGTRQALGGAAFTAAWDAGRAMTVEQAVEYALAHE